MIKMMTFKKANLIGAVLSFSMIITALIIQLSYQLEPCPLCITQRIIYIVLGFILLLDYYKLNSFCLII